ncbi:hypothetical protein JVU11DRAFT_12046 [Chiua virens]|nr:hypothetical protein JVU11DRAFT_12046 [Chiua virens]
MVWARAWSSLANLDSPLPRKYPVASTHPLPPLSHVPHQLKAGYAISPQTLSPLMSTYSSIRTNPEADASPKMVSETSYIHHVRIGHLYLGASTSDGQLEVFIYYDGNVFIEEVVRE